MSAQSSLRSLATFLKVDSFFGPILKLQPKSSSSDDAGVESELSLANDLKQEKTKLYLAYGSNLAKKTFQERRKIKPLRSINVLVPSLELVFDLPGIPYAEPAFANSRKSENAPPHLALNDEKESLIASSRDPRSAATLGWTKGLVGTVYEVTDSDFARIIASEGGGSSYADIEVDCFPLSKDLTEVPSNPTGETFKAHTLFADLSSRRGGTRKEGWAEPSARYLGLITSGAIENELPLEYRKWLEQVRPFRATRIGQKIGKFVLFLTWGPLVVTLFTITSLLSNKKTGQAPKWMAVYSLRLFTTIWKSYDYFFKFVFGEGERTIGDPVEE